MAYAHHDKRVKHLNGTAGCTHYRGLEASSGATTRCAAHVSCCRGAAGGKDTSATRGCHVIMANQSPASGVRYIIYCCAACNGSKDGASFDVRSNAVMHNLDGGACHAVACGGAAHPKCSCGVNF